ncbi:hypothetical protein ID866_2998 [Astraeus odoratus]|nr:hypothetical protein ID866_2998 [Astraeus odoratus]
MCRQLKSLGMCHSMALFPWDYNSLGSLWSGAMDQPDIREGWASMVDAFSGAIAIGGTDMVAIYPSKGSEGGFCLRTAGGGVAVCISSYSSFNRHLRGMAVKLWRLPQMSIDKMAREDKPLFSSTRIHRARILTVNWLSLDVLVTSSAPAHMRRNGDRENLYFEDGTIAIWHWLGFDRFFPPNRPTPTKVMRGCASDYQESCELVCAVAIVTFMRHLCSILQASICGPDSSVYKTSPHCTDTHR